MCQLIYLGSVEPLPASDGLELHAVPYPGQAPGDYADFHAVLPDARHLYSLGGCWSHAVQLQMLRGDLAGVKPLNLVRTGRAQPWAARRAGRQPLSVVLLIGTIPDNDDSMLATSGT